MNLPALLDDLKLHEGYRQYVYDDATGKPIRPGDTVQGWPTIGYGLNLATTGISAQQAAALLEPLAIAALTSASRLVANFSDLGDVRQNVLAEMAYNLGPVGLRGFAKMLSAVIACDFETAAAEMLDSAWAHQVGPRAAVLAERMKTGQA